ncbi:hypothetical protein HOC11_07315 [archaeon]|nr:hypothetical protein [archaeon]
MGKLTKVFSSFKIWVYIIFFIITLAAISPNPWNSGVAIRNVDLNSTAELSGIKSANPNEVPMVRERIISINGNEIKNVEDYNRILSTIKVDSSVNIVAEKSQFMRKDYNNYAFRAVGDQNLGMTVYEAPKSNIRLGLDLQGGTRVVLSPDEKLSKDDMDLLIDNLNQRINVLGLSDVIIRNSLDLTGNQFIIIEIAGANEKDVENILAKQGKFEAKIANDTVFRGGKEDITFVCRTSADCQGIDPQFGCQESAQGVVCRYYFQISISQNAANKFAETTNKITVLYDGGDPSGSLSEPIDFYLDDVKVQSLNIGGGLKGRPETSIAISVVGSGLSGVDARNDANDRMKQIQTLLITGSLPVKLNIIKTDSISPSLGKEFLQNAMLIGLLSIIAVTAIVILRYKKWKIAFPIITVITSEILLILGVAALLKQNIDIAGIAGIIVAIGTGVDDQIVITDETIGKDDDDEYKFLSWAQKLKKAFFIVFAAYAATVASMIPLLFAGAGLLKGFAVTTIIGVTNGVFITRPAFAKLMEILVSDDDKE